jgi:hypothetical protein
MAGDIDVHEEAIVGDVGADARGADELAASVVEGGGAIHQYGRQVLIATVLPNRAQEIVEQRVPGATVAAEAAAVSESVRGGLDEVEALGLEAFALRQSEEYGAAKAHGRMVRAAGALRQAAWYHKGDPTFALALVRKELWVSATFHGSPERSEMVRAPRAFVERLTDAVCYAA